MSGGAVDAKDIPLAPRVAAWVREYTDGPLTKEEFDHFFERGWLIKKDVLDPETDLNPSRDAVSRLVDGLAQRLFRAGKISSLHEDAPFERRLYELEQEHPDASVLLHKEGVLPAEVAALWSGKKLMGIAHQILGPDLVAHPVWNLRSKTPHQTQAEVVRVSEDIVIFFGRGGVKTYIF